MIQLILYKDNIIEKNTHIFYMLLVFFSICFSEFLKRFIFINGAVSNVVYYGCIFFLPMLTVIGYILLGNLKLDRKKIVIFMIFTVSQIVIVGIFHRDNFTKLIIYFGATLFYILPFLLKKSDNINHKSYNSLFFALFVVVFGYGVAQHFAGYFPWDKNWDTFSPTGMNLDLIGNSGAFVRAYSCFSGVQEFASFTIFTIFLLWIYIRKIGYKLILIILLLSALYITGAKSVMISLFVALIIYFFRKRINPLLLFTAIYILPYIVLLSFYHIYYSDLTVFFSEGNQGLFNYGTMAPRLEIAHAFFDSFKPENWLGEGAGCASVLTDNMFIRILMEYGFIGLIIFMFFLWTIFRQLFYMTKTNKNLFLSKEIQSISERENLFFFLLFFVITLSFHTGELLYSRHSIILFMFIIIGINEKYNNLKKYEAKTEIQKELEFVKS